MSSVKAVTGAASGALDSATAYMEEYGTLDGSTSAILEGASVGYVKGAFSGAVEGAIAGAVKYKVKPKCFVAGTFVLTAIGLTCIEDIRPGDYVYAKNETTGEQEYMPVLETYINEIDTTYIVTINGESIETTVGHPFYTTDKGWVGAGSLEVGDTVELSDGSSGEVESVEKNELDEPVTIYNINVMDYHTYYVGKNEVLVHNAGDCDVKLDVDGINSKLVDGSSGNTNDILDLASDFLGEGYTEPVLGSGRFVSADGTRVFRMGENDILGRHGGGSHVNFEFLKPNPTKAGKMQVVKDIHIYLED